MGVDVEGKVTVERLEVVAAAAGKDRPAASAADGVLGPAPEAEPAEEWFDGLAFKGPLDPAGTLFAFALAVVATVALVVLVAGVVRALGAA